MKHWRQLSLDPNSVEAIEVRRKSVIGARGSSLVKSRNDYLCSLAEGKDVLDVGVVEHTRIASGGKDWLHGRICSVARRCLGVDILEEEVDYLKTQGFDVLCHDLTREPLSGSFDLIVCGEVLEHVDAPGLLFKHLVQMLRPGGRLAVTAPNPWYLNVVFKNVFRPSVFVDSTDHVAWFDPWTISELAERHQLQLTRFTGVAITQPRTLLSKLVFSLQPFLVGLGVKKECFAKTLIYEFVRE